MTPALVPRLFEWGLVGMLASGYLAIASSGIVDFPSLALAGAAIAARVAMLITGFRLSISEVWTNIAALAILAFYPIDYFYLSRDFLQASIHLLFLLGSVLVLRATTRRDFFLVKMSALLQLVAAALVSTGLAYLTLLSAFALCAIAVQISGEIMGRLRDGQPVARGGLKGVGRRVAGVTVFAFAGILLLGAGFFFILPRTARLAFQHLMADRFRIPGFANEVRLGEIGEIRLTHTPVMHARIYNVDKPLALKWRGSALARFDGRRWYNGPDLAVRLPLENGRLVTYDTAAPPGPRVTAEVQLKNATGDVLFFPGAPEMLRVEAPFVFRSPVAGYRLPAGFARGARYYVLSRLEDVARGPTEVPAVLDESIRLGYLETPSLDPRIARLTGEIVAGQPTDYARALAIAEHLRTRLAYTIELPKTPPADPIADFLFVRKKGHCEYFASAMALMLRTIHIPSRMATGFQSGAFNPVSGWYLIRTSDAHTWVEAHIPGFGWVTFDPTPPDTSSRAAGLWARISLYLDALDVFWQEWVIAYDLERQVTLAERMTRSSRRFSLDWIERWDGLMALARRVRLEWTRVHTFWVLVAVACLAASWRVVPWLARRWKMRRRVEQLRKGRAVATDATLLYQRMLEVLARRSLHKPSWMTPSEFAASVPPGALSGLIAELTGAYHQMRFGGRTECAPRMVELIERMETSPRRI